MSDVPAIALGADASDVSSGEPDHRQRIARRFRAVGPQPGRNGPVGEAVVGSNFLTWIFNDTTGAPDDRPHRSLVFGLDELPHLRRSGPGEMDPCLEFGSVRRSCRTSGTTTGGT